MPPRRSHAKSRRGCVSCKSRHVKCDESGPPCERCKARGTACEYATFQTNYEAPSSLAKSRVEVTPDTLPLPEVVFPADRRLLELQLMHRWSTETYRSLCSPGTDDDEVWQIKVPTWAVRYDFLLNGLLALSAFDVARLASEPDYERYVNAATEFHGFALSTFRSHLPLLSPESHEAALCLSLMLMGLAFYSAQISRTLPNGEHSSMVESAIVHFELVRGCVPVAEIRIDYIANNPYIRKLRPFNELPRTPMDARLSHAFSQLSELNHKRIISIIHESDERRAREAVYWEACKHALDRLRECYEKCVDITSQGYALGWLNLAGEDYIKALKDNDLAALLLLLLWGLLLDSLGRQVWWAEQFGSLLVNEVSTSVLSKHDDPDVKILVDYVLEMMRTQNKGKP